jgi:hypothetical protein
VVQSIENEIAFSLVAFRSGLRMWSYAFAKSAKRSQDKLAAIFYKNLAREFGAPLPSV